MIKPHKDPNLLVPCKICQFQGWDIHHHLKSVHNISCDEYKALYIDARISYNPNKGRTAQTHPDKIRWGKAVSSTRKKLFKEGKISSWCKGLTKETDPRLLLQAQRQSITMKDNYNNGLTVWNEGKTAKQDTRVRKNVRNRVATMKREGLFEIAAAKTSVIRHATNNYPQKYKGLTKEDCPMLARLGRKVSVTLKQGYKSGRLKQPNRGRTKETHPDKVNWGAAVSVTRKKQFASRKLFSPRPVGITHYGNGGIRKDLGHYVRSGLEANFCRILKRLKVKYFYEPDKFVLKDEKGQIFGTYTPDIYIPKEDKYIELKGRLFEKDKIKMEMFRQQYPKEKFEIIFQQSERWKQMRNQYRDVIPNWEK
jgi:hypothetical protein